MSAKSKTHSRGTQNVTRLRKVESLERLKDRVEAAADEIVRLRTVNNDMASDIADLRSTIAAAESERKRAVVFDENPDELREKVRGFISAIDDYLQTES